MENDIIFNFLLGNREEEISEKNWHLNSVSDYYSSIYDKYHDDLENQIYQYRQAHSRVGRPGFYGVPKPPLNSGYDENYEYD